MGAFFYHRNLSDDVKTHDKASETNRTSRFINVSSGSELKKTGENIKSFLEADDLEPSHVNFIKKNHRRKNLQGLDPKLQEVHAVWNFLNQRDIKPTLPVKQNMHFRMKELFELQAHEFLQFWKPNRQVRTLVEDFNKKFVKQNQYQGGGHRGSRKKAKVIGLHYRLGDKANEITRDAMGSQVVGIPPAFGNPGKFLNMALDLAKDFDWPMSKEEIQVVVMSDDMNEAMEELSAQQASFDPPLPLTLMPIGESNIPGHDQFTFNERPFEERLLETRKFVSQVEWLRSHTDGIICSASSNIATALMLASGKGEYLIGERPLIRSVDQRWAPTTYPSGSYNSTKFSLEELMWLAKDLLKDKNNLIDL
ncbi:hypothetical protein O181_024262 [Austropuccinia psidii MF-1]|uniref:Uncharacterized protein n=1 Tax=Austropuccinia psidii MF-1 TaxID=1389203 RepID=A0A9Q3CL65_9BASI|nr:hypothetical protein [Austropuccinia psidii MF-1]